MKLVLIQHEPCSFEEKKKNLNFIHDTIKEYISNHQTPQGTLFVFPELSLSNFFRDDSKSKQDYWLNTCEPIPGPSTKSLEKLAQKEQIYLIVGMAEKSSLTMLPYNSSVLIGPDGLIGTYRKTHLPPVEKDYFLTDNDFPVFPTPYGNIGMMICYDLAFPEVARALTLNGADIIVSIASNWQGGKGGIANTPEMKNIKSNMLETMPTVRAMENQVYIVICSATGKCDMGPRGIWEREASTKIIDCFGRTVSENKTQSMEIVTGFMKLDHIYSSRTMFHYLKDIKEHLTTSKYKYNGL